MKIRVAIAVLLVCVLPLTAAEKPFDNLVPSEAMLFVVCDSVTEVKNQFKQTNFYQIFENPGVQDFLSNIYDTLAVEITEAQAGQQPVADAGRGLLSLMRGQVGFYVNVRLGAPQAPAPGAAPAGPDVKIDWALLTDVGDQSPAAVELVAQIANLAIEKGAQRADAPTRGATITTLTFTPAPNPEGKPKTPFAVSLVVSDSLMVVASSVQVVQDVLSRRAGEGTPGLISDPYYAHVLQRTGGGSVIRFYIATEKILQTVQQGLMQAGGPGMMVSAIVGQLGLNSVKGIGAAIGFNQGQHDMTSRALLHLSGPRMGLMQGFKTTSMPVVPDTFVPAKIGSYAAFNFDLLNFYNTIIGMVARFQPAIEQTIQQQLQQLDPNGAPISIREDFLAPLNNRIAICQQIGEFNPAKMNEFQQAVFALGLKDRATLEKALTRVNVFGPRSALHQEPFLGTTIYQVSQQPGQGNAGPGMMGGQEFGLAVTDQYLFFATNLSLLRECISQAANPDSGLGSTREWQRVTSMLPKQASGFSYGNSAEMLKGMYEMVHSNRLTQMLSPILMMTMGAKAGRLVAAFDGSKLPEFSEIRPHLGLSGGWSSLEEDGFYSESFLLKPAVKLP